MRKALVTAASAALLLASTSSARADDHRGTVDWSRVLMQLDTLARTGSAEKPQGVARVERRETSTDPYVHNAGNAWFGAAPRVAIVARDWAAAYRVAGDRLALVDAMRLSASTRMVVSRVRFGDLRVARMTPFVQLGLGQWRTDPNLLPLTPRSTEIAGQAGGGFELQVARNWQLACESTVTALYREQREATDVPQTRLWSVALASHIQF